MKFNRIYSVLTFGIVCLVSGCAAKPSRVMPVPDSVWMEGVIVPTSEIEEVQREKIYPLPPYETLVYEMRWLGLRVGTVTASIKGLTEHHGREVYRLELLARSNSWLGKIFHIDSRFESLLDVEKMTTVRQRVNRVEGFYRKDATILYDHDNHMASFHNQVDDTRKVYPIPSQILDALSSIYYFRTFSLHPGERVEFTVDVNEKIYGFGANILETKPVRIPGFELQPAVFVEPDVTFEDEHVRRGRVKGYFSQGQYRIPLTAVIEAPIFTKATVTLKQVSYSPTWEEMEFE
jgi:hypothetical protein